MATCRSPDGVAYSSYCLSIFSHLTMFVIHSSTSEIQIRPCNRPLTAQSPSLAINALTVYQAVQRSHFSHKPLKLLT